MVLTKPILVGRSQLCHKHHILIISVYIWGQGSGDCQFFSGQWLLIVIDQSLSWMSKNPVNTSRDSCQQPYTTINTYHVKEMVVVVDPGANTVVHYFYV